MTPHPQRPAAIMVAAATLPLCVFGACHLTQRSNNMTHAKMRCVSPDRDKDHAISERDDQREHDSADSPEGLMAERRLRRLDDNGQIAPGALLHAKEISDQ